MVELIVAGCCLITEAFFSSSEIAVLSADRALMRSRAQKGSIGAKRVEQFLQAPHRLFATALLGTQLSLIISTVMVTLWLDRTFGSNKTEWLLLVGLSPVVVVFGETVPKAIVRERANDWAPRMAWLLHQFGRFLFPLVSLLSWTSLRAARWFGISGKNKLVSREDIEALVSHHPSGNADLTPQKNGVVLQSDVTEGERSMIAHILALSDVTVTDVMVPLSGIVALAEDVPLVRAAVEINDKKYSRIPIYRERLDQIVGVVHAFDVLKALPVSLRVGEIMRVPLFVPESTRLLDLLSNMQRSQQSLAVVVDEYGGAVGMVTQEDILEEVVGDIEDEYDLTTSVIRKNADGSYTMPASVSIDAINQELGISLPESEDYETLGGLLLERWTRIPRSGEVLSIDGVSVRVIAVSARRIEEVNVTVPPPSKSTA